LLVYNYSKCNFSTKEESVIKGWETLDAIERQPDKGSGARVFRVKRVPVAASDHE
jgi:hypothetical protein